MNAPRVVLITGAANGIGWATAQCFAAQGDRVVVLDLNGVLAKTKAAELGAAHLGLALDVSLESEVMDVIQAIHAKYARIDVLVNNAGIGDQSACTIDQSVDAFDRVLNVHLRGTYLMSREVARVMLLGGSGAIVNLSSIAALGGIPGRNAYGAAKAGISAMTRSMASEWAGQGLRVNAVAPGYVRTELVAKLEQEGALDTDKINHRTPMGRMAEPAEIARSIVFLASSAASYITGATLSVDGGWSALGAAI